MGEQIKSEEIDIKMGLQSLISRAKAPLRLGIGGGGTDLSPYCEKHGGAVLNATVDLYAHCTIEKSSRSSCVIFLATDIGIEETVDISGQSFTGLSLMLHSAVYLRVMNDFFDEERLPLKVTTSCDAPPGSGLGSSSTLVVSMLSAYKQHFNLPLGEYDIAKLAYQIEREDCGLAGGKQDQYAATFGGFNFMEFMENQKVIVNPLRIRREIISELESWMILYYTGTSRHSAEIINDQIDSVVSNHSNELDAMHEVKATAYKMKEFLLLGDIEGLANEMAGSWAAKKLTSSSVTNPLIETLESKAMMAGATSLKISGAGGGGFMMIFVDPSQRSSVENMLKEEDGQLVRFTFTQNGGYSWTV